MTRVIGLVRRRGRVLVVRDAGATGADSRGWHATVGRVDDADPSAEAAGRRALRGVIGSDADDLAFVRAGRPLDRGDPGADATRPVLFEADARTPTVDDGVDAAEWVDPTEFGRRVTAPPLREAWRRVAPTVDTVRTDRTHGSAWIAARALEVLRDAARESDGWDAVAAIARDLRSARPEMAAVASAVDRAVAAAAPVPAAPDAVVEGAIDALDEVLAADDGAARTAATRLRAIDADGVATLSRSGTVRAAVASLSPDRLVVAESRPEREGVGVAERAAADADAAVTLTTEAGLPTAIDARGVDAVLVGADAISPDGDVVNKTGTRVLALAARDAGVPVYAAASTFKIRPTNGPATGPDQASPAEAVYDGDADVSVHAPTFETVPGALVDGVACETGMLDAAGVRAVAEAYADAAAWVERSSG